MCDLFKPEDGQRPAEGQVVGVVWDCPILGCGHGVAEYHYIKARCEGNSHIWHAPEDPSDDFREPEYWFHLPAIPSQQVTSTGEPNGRS